MNCDSKRCPNLALFRCQVCDPKLSCCLVHTQSHMREFPHHKLTNICIEIGELTKLSLIMHLENLLIKVKSTKSSILESLNDFITRVTIRSNSALAELREIEMLYKNSIKLLERERYINADNMKDYEELVIAMKNSEEKVNEEVSMIEKKKKYIDEAILDEECSKLIIGEYEKVKAEHDDVKQAIGGQIFVNTIINKGTVPRICFFKTNTKNLINVDLIGENDIVSEPLPGLVDNLCSYSACCSISDSELFFYGGYNGNTKADWMYLINVEDKKAVKLGVKKNLRNHACCFVNGSIYVFGGALNQANPTNEAEMATLKDDWKINGIPIESWKPLTNQMPAVNAYLTSAVIGNRIALLGYNQNTLYIYDTEKFNWQSAYAFSGNYKTLVCSKGKMYVLNCNDLYRIGILNIDQCIKIDAAAGVPNDWTISPPILYNNKFYLLFSNLELYCFNLETEKLVRIRKIN